MTPSTAQDMGALRAQERQSDAEQIARAIQQSHPDDQAAMAYQHASRGCPLSEDTVSCPLCDPPLALAPDVADEEF